MSELADLDPVALKYTLSILNRRRYTVKQIQDKLAQRGCNEGDRQLIVDHLLKLGFLNDRSFAEAWVHDRDMLSPKGSFILRQELYKQGVPEDIIVEVLRERGSEDDLEAAKDVLRRTRARYQGLDKETLKRRQMALLSRRGFSYDVISRILDM